MRLILIICTLVTTCSLAKDQNCTELIRNVNAELDDISIDVVNNQDRWYINFRSNNDNQCIYHDTQHKITFMNNSYMFLSNGFVSCHSDYTIWLHNSPNNELITSKIESLILYTNTGFILIDMTSINTSLLKAIKCVKQRADDYNYPI